MSYRGLEREFVSAVRARESRLTHLRCELRMCVSHEDTVLTTSKLAQWVEQRTDNPRVAGSNPVLAAIRLFGWNLEPRNDARLGLASRCPGDLAGDRSAGRSQRVCRFERLGYATPEAP